MALKDHKLKSADDIRIHSRTGVVKGSANWSDTYVSGGGGANNTNVQVSSNVVQRQKFFIREADGDEVEVNDAGLGVRDGHVVTVVYCGSKAVAGTTGWAVYFANRSTGATSRSNSTLGVLSGQLSGCLPVGAVVVLLLCVILLFTRFVIIGLPVGALLAFWLFSARNKSKALTEAIIAAAQQEVERTRPQADELKAQSA